MTLRNMKNLWDDNGDSILKYTTKIPEESLEAVVTIGD